MMEPTGEKSPVFCCLNIKLTRCQASRPFRRIGEKKLRSCKKYADRGKSSGNVRYNFFIPGENRAKVRALLLNLINCGKVLDFAEWRFQGLIFRQAAGHCIP